VGSIVAIGGGHIPFLNAHGKATSEPQTRTIDHAIMGLVKSKNPKVLFIPTASGDSESYSRNFQLYYQSLGASKVNVLYLFDVKRLPADLKGFILDHDIIYVGGGNTLRMMRLWKKRGVDVILRDAYNRGIVLSGLSAYAICWFRFGNSDSLSFSQEGTDQLIRVRGLSLINALVCPHYSSEKNRQNDLPRMMKDTPCVGLAVDDRAVIILQDDMARVVSESPQAKAYRCYYGNGIFYKKARAANKQYARDNLFKKGKMS